MTAFFDVWRITCHIWRFKFRSTVCLASNEGLLVHRATSIQHTSSCGCCVSSFNLRCDELSHFNQISDTTLRFLVLLWDLNPQSSAYKALGLPISLSKYSSTWSVSCGFDIFWISKCRPTSDRSVAKHTFDPFFKTYGFHVPLPLELLHNTCPLRLVSYNYTWFFVVRGLIGCWISHQRGDFDYCSPTRHTSYTIFLNFGV